VVRRGTPLVPIVISATEIHPVPPIQNSVDKKARTGKSKLTKEESIATTDSAG